MVLGRSRAAPNALAGNRDLKSVDLPVFLCAAFMGLAILLAEGLYLGPVPATLIALVAAAVTLVFLLASFRSFALPAGLGWLLAMVLIGSLSASVGMSSGRVGNQIDLFRDVIILFAYMGFMLVGYYFGRDRAVTLMVWWVLVVVGSVRSLTHLWLFVGQVTSGVSDVYILRLEAGRGDQVQLVAVVACCLILREGRTSDGWKRVAKLAAGLCVISMTLALSRVLLTELIIVAMVFSATRPCEDNRFLRLNLTRAVTVAGSGVAALTVALVSLRFVSEPAFAFVYEGFIEKLFNSWNEVASTQQQSAADIDQNYRAFESDRGVQSFADAGWFAQWFGQGWGTAVQLGLDTASTRSDFVRTEAAFLHNGYIGYLVKVGLLGLACYVGFMLRLIHLAVFEPGDEEEGTGSLARRQALLSLILCLAAASLTGGGFGFPAGFLSFALIIGTCLYDPSRPGQRARARGTRIGSGVS